MSRKILLFAIIITLLAMFHQLPAAHAEDHRTITITGIQMSNVFRAAPFSQPFTTNVIKYREVGVVNGQFRIHINAQKTQQSPPTEFYFIWLAPELKNGKISCTITQIQVEGEIFTQKELMQPNPYFSDLNGDIYCNSFLSPFLVGYGADVVIAAMTLKYHVLVLDLVGTLLQMHRVR
jgi:hypothetical protein